MSNREMTDIIINYATLLVMMLGSLWGGVVNILDWYQLMIGHGLRTIVNQKSEHVRPLPGSSARGHAANWRRGSEAPWQIIVFCDVLWCFALFCVSKMSWWCSNVIKKSTWITLQNPSQNPSNCSNCVESLRRSYVRRPMSHWPHVALMRANTLRHCKAGDCWTIFQGRVYDVPTPEWDNVGALHGEAVRR